MGPFLDSTMSFGAHCNFSETTAERIDDEVSRLMERTCRRVKEIVLKRRRALERITAELQNRETIGREDLERILSEIEANPRPLSPRIQRIGVIDGCHSSL